MADEGRTMTDDELVERLRKMFRSRNARLLARDSDTQQGMELSVNYAREISDRNQWIAEYQAKIAALEAELDQLWRDEGIAKIDHEVPLGGWRDEPQPILCRKCRKEPSLVTKKQRQVDAVVEGRLTRVWQDYYVYDLTKGELWGKSCRGDYYAEIRWQEEAAAWRRNRDPNDYDGGC